MYFRSLTVTSLGEAPGIPASRHGGMTLRASGPRGAILVMLHFDPRTGQDRYTITLEPTDGSGGTPRNVASGVLDAAIDPTEEPSK